MANREPTLYELYTSPVNEFDWTEDTSFTLRELAYRRTELLTAAGFRVKVDVTHPNGITTFRVFEGGKRAGVTVTPSPTPAPAPTPSPPPIPALQFNRAVNSMYKILF